MIKLNYDTQGNILGFYPENINYDFTPEPYILRNEETHQELINGKKMKVENNQLIEITPEEIEIETTNKNKQTRISELKQELYELDIKSIRAMREGGSNENGVEWVDFYNQQINALRNELIELELLQL